MSGDTKSIAPIGGVAASSEEPAVLRVAGVSKLFDVGAGRRKQTLRAVDGVDLVVHEGETVGLVGESGSGKSTLARLINRLDDPTTGVIELDGTDITALSGDALRRARTDFQMVFQDPYSSFDPTSSLRDSVLEPVENRDGRVPRREGDALVTELFKQVNLDPSYSSRRPRELSGGQLQRAAIARGLATHPRLLILDEPVSALDVSTQAQVVNVLVDLKHNLNISMVFIAHDLAVVRHISDTIAVMYLGRIVEQGPASVIYEAPRHPYTAALLASVPVANPRVQKARERRVLSGEIPSAMSLPQGCRFASRCPNVMDICRQIDPPRVAMDDGVEVECHLYGSPVEINAA